MRPTVAAAGGCPLCALVPAEVAAATRLVHDGGDWTAHVPFAAGHPFATLLAPRTHVLELADLDDAGRDGLAAALVDVVGRYDRIYAAPLPYLMWIHPGVHLHVHFAPVHRAPGVLRYVASAEVGAAMLSNPVAPEVAAQLLRDAVNVAPDQNEERLRLRGPKECSRSAPANAGGTWPSTA